MFFLGTPACATHMLLAARDSPQPTLSKLGVQLDTRTAQALISKEPGLAAKVLLSIKQQLDGLTTNLQVRLPSDMQCRLSNRNNKGLDNLLTNIFGASNAIHICHSLLCWCAGCQPCQQEAAAVHCAHIALAWAAGGAAPQVPVCSPGCQQQQVSCNQACHENLPMFIVNNMKGALATRQLQTHTLQQTLSGRQ